MFQIRLICYSERCKIWKTRELVEQGSGRTKKTDFVVLGIVVPILSNAVFQGF